MPKMPVESWGRLTRDAHDWQALTQADGPALLAQLQARLKPIRKLPKIRQRL